MKSVTYFILAVLTVAGFASAGGRKNFVPGGTILDIEPVGRYPGRSVAGPRGVRDLLNRRAVVVVEEG